MFGRIISFTKQGNSISFRFEKHTGRIEIITDRIINVFAGFETEEHLSKAIEGAKSVAVEYSLEQDQDRFIIKTRDLIVEVFDDFKVDFYDRSHELLCADYRKSRRTVSPVSSADQELAAKEGHAMAGASRGRRIEVMKAMDGDEAFYGLGDKTGFLNKRGYEYEMWNSDLPDPQVDSFKALYKSIPFFITLKKKHVFGIFFDNTYRTYFDMGKESNEYYFFGADEGNLDYYFIAGDTMPEILEGYTYLTGTTPLPQAWTLGYHQSRWSYRDRDEVMSLAKRFRTLGIPCDCIHLDIDYMEAYKVFTWSSERFPDAEGMLQELAGMGFKAVTIIDPGVKIEKSYDVYEEGMREGFFLRDSKGDVYENEVWPGPSVYPDFSAAKVRDWWGGKLKRMTDKGVRGIWNDMNEPASFRGPLPDDVQFQDEGRGAKHKKMHNVYGHLMAKATYEGLRKHDSRRPYIITRACYSGSQKYATVWTGDNHSIWAHLQMAIPQLCNLGLSGVAFAGTDVGGFGSDCTPELLCRWMQVGCFSPFFRNHSAMGTRRQEPWAFDQNTLDICRRYIRLRYRLLPYLYDLFRECEQSGMPVMRPLVLEYEQDENVMNMNDQFLLGSHILVAPVVNQGQRVRTVYLPQGTWMDYWTKEAIQGGRYILKEAPIDICPVYVRAGSILPNYPEINYVGEQEIDELILDICPGAGEYHHYQDNGEDFAYRQGGYNEYAFTLTEGNQLKIRLLHQGYDRAYKSFRLLWKGRELVIPFTGETIICNLDE